MRKELFASLATVAVAFSTLAPLVPADAAQGRQPTTSQQCQRLRGVSPWVPYWLNMKHCKGFEAASRCLVFGKPYCE